MSSEGKRWTIWSNLETEHQVVDGPDCSGVEVVPASEVERLRRDPPLSEMNELLRRAYDAEQERDDKRAEVERLTREYGLHIGANLVQIEDQQAEVERLREALDSLVRLAEEAWPHTATSHQPALRGGIQIAQGALHPDEKEER